MGVEQASNKQDHHHYDRTMEFVRDEEIWYFGFGPVVHPQVRQRRGVQTSHEQAAVLRDHRLTFAFGGVATIVPKIGFTVHGVVMKLADDRAWERLKQFDSGAVTLQEHDVFPYNGGGGGDDDDENDGFDDGDEAWFEDRSGSAITCFVSVTMDFDEPCLDQEIVKKPQERYLRLIANGMVQNGVDETYVGDEIMSCPFIPTRKEADWCTFPLAPQYASCPEAAALPTITHEGYQKLCQKASRRASTGGGPLWLLRNSLRGTPAVPAEKTGCIYFIMNNHVMKLITATAQDPSNEQPKQQQSQSQQQSSQAAPNPTVGWMRTHAHGQDDITHLVHQIVIDPNIPYAATKEELTERHYRWAEDHMHELLLQSDVTAEKVYALTSTTSTSTKTTTTRSTPTPMTSSSTTSSSTTTTTSSSSSLRNSCRRHHHHGLLSKRNSNNNNNSIQRRRPSLLQRMFSFKRDNSKTSIHSNRSINSNQNNNNGSGAQQ